MIGVRQHRPPTNAANPEMRKTPLRSLSGPLFPIGLTLLVPPRSPIITDAGNAGMIQERSRERAAGRLRFVQREPPKTPGKFSARHSAVSARERGGPGGGSSPRH